METCECGALHAEGLLFYATAVHGGRVAYLAGPLSSHADALAVLPSAREEAQRRDAWAVFYAFGTASITPVANPPRGRLNEVLGIL